MKKWLERKLGASWKTTLLSYFMALLIAIQPMLTENVDFTSRREWTRYVIRLVFAGLIAVFGKIAADSSQVKKVDDKVDRIDS